jgi:predicted transcriptional regulator
MTNSKHLYANESEVESVVRGFEDCETQPSDFTHAAHLTVALWYLTQSGMSEAATKMRAHLLRFINHYKEQGYNETITVFWLRVVQSFMKAAPTGVGGRSVTELANELTASYNDSRLIYDYYSKELLSTQAAKADFVEPDLRLLDF